VQHPVTRHRGTLSYNAPLPSSVVGSNQEEVTVTAQPEHPGADQFTPPMRTLAELREALSTWGFPGDRQKFEAELDAIELDDLTRVREITQAYRHRILMRYSPGAMAALARPTRDVEAELRRKLTEAAR
jgi:hypothetical protein